MNSNLDPYNASQPSVLGAENNANLAASKEKEQNKTSVRLSSGRMGSMSNMNANREMVKKMK